MLPQVADQLQKEKKRATAEEANVVWVPGKLLAATKGVNAANWEGRLLAVMGKATAVCKGGSEGKL